MFLKMIQNIINLGLFQVKAKVNALFLILTIQEALLSLFQTEIELS